jgi:hypothetical protein
MLTFEITAIDLILVIAVIVLLLLYVTKLANSPEELIRKSMEKNVRRESSKMKYCNSSNNSDVNDALNECPRGFGKIGGVGDDNSISERCFSCYKMSQCYVNVKKIEV